MEEGKSALQRESVYMCLPLYSRAHNPLSLPELSVSGTYAVQDRRRESQLVQGTPQSQSTCIDDELSCSGTQRKRDIP